MNDSELDRDLRRSLDELTAHVAATTDVDARLDDIHRRSIPSPRRGLGHRPDRMLVSTPESAGRSWLTAAAAAGVVALLGTASILTFGAQSASAGCGPGIVEPDALSSVRTFRIDGECVGVTDGSNANVLPAAGLDEPRTTILAENRRLWFGREPQPERSLVTIVYLGALTAESSVATDQLRGIAEAQQKLNRQVENPSLIRVLLANAGTGMRHGSRIADELARLKRADPTIAGVIGFTESSAAALETVRALERAGLPVVSTSSSIEGAETNPWYSQLAPTNRREADVVAAYAAHLRASGAPPYFDGRVRIVTPPRPDDLYLTTLADTYRSAFATHGMEAEQLRDDLGVKSLGAQLCGFGGLVIYAGRKDDFGAFLDTLARPCSIPPLLIAASSVVDRPTSPIPYRYITFTHERDGDAIEPYDHLLSLLSGEAWARSIGPPDDDKLVAIRLSTDSSRDVLCSSPSGPYEPWCP